MKAGKLVDVRTVAAVAAVWILWAAAAAAAQLEGQEAFNRGMALMEGTAASRDVRSGLAWLERAAGQGFAPAIYQLGVYHETGVVIDGVATRTNYVECTDADGVVRRVAVPELAMTEEIVWKADEREALKCYREAKDKGLAWGTWKVGMFAEYGIGCRQDPEFARRCYKAAAGHVPQAAKALERLERQGVPPPSWSPEAVFGELKRQWMPERMDELF